MLLRLQENQSFSYMVSCIVLFFILKEIGISVLIYYT